MLLGPVLIGEAQGQALTWQQTAGPRGNVAVTFLQDSGGALFAGARQGVLRSQDGGGLWQPVLTAPGASGIFVDEDGSLLVRTHEGLYRSHDDGASWHLLDLGPDSTMVLQVVRSVEAGLFVRTRDGAFRSSDDGATWEEANDGFDYLAAHLQTLAVSPEGRVYAGTRPWCCLGFDSAIFRWDADSLHWDRVADAEIGGHVATIVFGPGDAVFAGSISAYLYGDGGFFRALDGEQWERVEGLGDVFTLEVHPSGTLFAGTPRGVWRSDDQGATWTSAGLDHLAVGTLAFTDEGDLVAGTRPHCFPAIDYPYCYVGLGVFRREADAEDWEAVDLGIVASDAGMLVPSHDGGMLAFGRAGLWRTDNRGASWQKLDRAGRAYDFPYVYTYAGGLVETPWGDLFLRIQLTELGGGFFRFSPDALPDQGTEWVEEHFILSESYLLAAVGDSAMVAVRSPRRGPPVFRSADRGATWTQAEGLEGFEVGSTLVAGLDDVLYLGGGRNRRIYRSTDMGATWEAFDIEAEGQGRFQTLAVAPDGAVYANVYPFLYRSEDQGQTWEQAGPDTVFTASLRINAQGHLFHAMPIRGQGSAVWVSRDKGWSWEAFTAGLEEVYVTSIALDAAGFIYVGTDGAGVFRSLTSTHVATDTPAESPPPFALHPNYPNPFNPVTTIPFTLKQPAHITLAIYDVLGRTVATVASGDWPAGVHAVAWDARGQPSGVYFYRLRTDRFDDVRTLMLLK